MGCSRVLGKQNNSVWWSRKIASQGRTGCSLKDYVCICSEYEYEIYQISAVQGKSDDETHAGKRVPSPADERHSLVRHESKKHRRNPKKGNMHRHYECVELGGMDCERRLRMRGLEEE